MNDFEKLKIPYPVIVEGKYDKLRLSSVIEAQIIATDGFGIFKNHERAALLRALARKTPLIVLTDPDGAGRLIRSHISGILPKDKASLPYSCHKRRSDLQCQIARISGWQLDDIQPLL